MKKFLKISVAVVFALAMVATAKSASATVTVPPNLMQGSHGAQVMNVQTVVGAIADGSYGPITKTKVATWQSDHGLPVDGVVGPITAAAMNGSTPSTGTLCPNGNTVASSCTLPPAGTSGPTCPNGNLISNNCLPSGTTGGALAGTDGSIADVNELGSYNNEEVGESANDVKVLGFEVEASNDGDIAIKSAKISVTLTNASGSDNLDDYAESIAVWMGSTKVGSANASDFNEDSSGVWTKTITLSSPVVKADKTEKFYVTVDAVGSFDSGDIDSEVATFDVENLRFIDGSGVTTTETGYDLDGMNVVADFVSFSASADTELKVTVDSATPVAGIQLVSDSDSTNDVPLLKGHLKVEGDSDVTVDELPITFVATTSGTANGVDDIATSVTLKIGSEEFSETMTLSAALSGTVTFDNLNFSINAGDTVDFQILADVQDIDGTVFTEGDTLNASLTSTNNDYIDAENEEGDQLTDDTEKTGTATGETQTLRSMGIQLTFVSASTSVAAGTSTSDDQGTFIIRYKIKAIGDTVYVSSLADATTGANTSGKTSVTVDRAGTATTGGVSTVLANITSTTMNSVGLYELTDGEENTFELTTTAQLPTTGAAGLFRTVLSGVRWDDDSTDSTPDNSYTSNLSSFKTSYVGLN